MASCVRTLLKGGYLLPSRTPRVCHLPARSYAAPARAQKKKEVKKEVEKEVKKEKRVIDDSARHKPYGLTAWAPVDDVYVARFYPRPVLAPAVALLRLKLYQELDATVPDQPVYIDLKLDMKLEKKKTVDAFVSTVQLPHSFSTGLNTVAVFTENPEQAQVAREQGAQFVGGPELVEQILEDEVSADFYISVPEMLPKIVPLKNKLRKKFPKSKRGSVGVNIPKMMAMFKTGFEYQVEKDCYVRTQIATLDMPTEHILANVKSILTDVCSHRPAEYGPFIERSILASHTSEALRFSSQEILQPPPADKS
ncbi:39S ribosomal protein L1, mitochondrial [Gadus chalcogrammus]|uniref:39S ribosomal protein L1, mitochondrial n=1 Tax=Gadus chalcogrammus TaxID=1042646 RepID=UPI0024C3FFB0|nr:39S ribosomal protein L1, mitochondrial [Gadus chalcogrammus]